MDIYLFFQFLFSPSCLLFSNIIDLNTKTKRMKTFLLLTMCGGYATMYRNVYVLKQNSISHHIKSIVAVFETIRITQFTTNDVIHFLFSFSTLGNSTNTLINSIRNTCQPVAIVIINSITILLFSPLLLRLFFYFKKKIDRKRWTRASKIHKYIHKSRKKVRRGIVVFISFVTLIN